MKKIIYTSLFFYFGCIAAHSSLFSDNKDLWFSAINRSDYDSLQSLAGESLLDVHDEVGNTALMLGASRGDTHAVEFLYTCGADLNLKNHDGETALHKAVRAGHYKMVAQLLEYGIDHTSADKSGMKALKYADDNFLHCVREYYQRNPSLKYQNKQPSSRQAETFLAELEHNGIVKISGLLNDDELSLLKNDFSQIMSRIESKIKNNTITSCEVSEDYFDTSQGMMISNDPFKDSETLVRLCCKTPLLETINYYLGKDVYIHKAWAARYLPGGKDGVGVFNWHHDAAGKRVKIMILLSDVTESGRYMTYILGSQNYLHPFNTYKENNVGLEYCKSYMNEIKFYKAVGKAGDIFIFDTNGIHTGGAGRDDGRDAFLVSYSYDKSHIWSCEVPEQFVQGACKDQCENPFLRMIEKRKKRKMLHPIHSRWTSSLRDVKSWV